MVASFPRGRVERDDIMIDESVQEKDYRGSADRLRGQHRGDISPDFSTRDSRGVIPEDIQSELLIFFKDSSQGVRCFLLG